MHDCLKLQEMMLLHAKLHVKLDWHEKLAFYKGIRML